MPESKIKTAMRGYSRAEVHEYILKMSALAEAEMQKYISETQQYKEELARCKKKLKEKDSIIKQLKNTL